MIDKLKVILIGFIVFFIFNESVFAANLGYMGTSSVGSCAPSGSSTYLWADSTYHDDYFTSIKFGGNGTAKLIMVDGSGGLISEENYTFTESNWSYTRSFSGTGVKGLKLCLESGNETFFMYGELSNTITPTATFEYNQPIFDSEPPIDEEPPGENDPCDGYLSEHYPECPDYNGGDEGGTDPPDDGTGGSTDPPSSGCTGCEILECPNWNEYMGKVDEIIEKIPGIPQWVELSNVFNEIVVPKVVDDFENMLGPAPDPPSDPLPLNPIDTGGFENEAPMMKENPELGESTFTLEDMENDAPEIEFREDPTGGFEIDNPLDKIPVINEFPLPEESSPPSEWNNIPDEAPIPFPSTTISEPIEIIETPIPNEQQQEIPIPNENIETPLPENNIETRPYYKSTPDI